SNISLDAGIASGTTTTTVPVTRAILVQPAASNDALNFTLRGAVQAGDVWTLALGSDSYTYTVLASDTGLHDVALGLKGTIAARAGGPVHAATVSGDTLSVTRLNAAATLTPALVGQQLTVAGNSGFYRLRSGTDFTDVASDADDATIQASLEAFQSIG